MVANENVADFRQFPLVVGPGAPEGAAALIDALNDHPGIGHRVVAAIRVGQRRWNLQMKSGMDVLLPEGHEAAALTRLSVLEDQHKLLDRPLARIDLRLPNMLVLRPTPAAVMPDSPGQLAETAGAIAMTRMAPALPLPPARRRIRHERHVTPCAAPAGNGPDETDRPRHGRGGPFGVLDIGTTKIVCLIGRSESDGTLRVLGFGWHKGRGVRGGGIVDLDEAERAIRAAVGQAEDMADTRLRSVTVNLTCGQPASRLFNVQWPIGGASGGRAWMTATSAA